VIGEVVDEFGLEDELLRDGSGEWSSCCDRFDKGGRVGRDDLGPGLQLGGEEMDKVARAREILDVVEFLEGENGDIAKDFKKIVAGWSGVAIVDNGEKHRVEAGGVRAFLVKSLLDG
jgi:hypothetical protein